MKAFETYSGQEPREQVGYGFRPAAHPEGQEQSKEGYAVGYPALPGCWSQRATEEEALQNIRIAIRESKSYRRI